MSPSRYEYMLQIIAPLIIKSSMRREAIHPSERLLITLRALWCSSDSNFTISCSYNRVGMTTSLHTISAHFFFSCIPFCTFEPTWLLLNISIGYLENLSSLFCQNKNKSSFFQLQILSVLFFSREQLVCSRVMNMKKYFERTIHFFLSRSCPGAFFLSGFPP